MNSPAPTYFYPNYMGRIGLLALEEILGRSSMEAVLDLAALSEYRQRYPPENQDLCIPFEHISRIQTALESTYGARGGRGLALRAGRACFRYGLRAYGSELGLTKRAFRLLPLPAKLKAGSEAFATLFNTLTDQRVRLERDQENIYWHTERCPLCWGRRTDEPCCYLAVGFVQEALSWISGGKCFWVEETRCIANGESACTIVINQEPLG